MSALPAPVVSSRLDRAFEVTADLLIATALLWAPPLALGAAAAALRYLWAS